MHTARHDTPQLRVRRRLIPTLVGLLDRYAVSVLLIPDVLSGHVRRSQWVVDAIRATAAEAIRREIAVHPVSDAQVRIAFRDGSGNPVKNKRLIDRLLAEAYPELTTSLPAARRLWDPEPYRAPLFHAVAMYWGWREALVTGPDRRSPRSNDSLD